MEKSEYPTFLPEGTIIRIGESYETKGSAVGVEFELPRDVN
jgi:hypothetical protein